MSSIPVTKSHAKIGEFLSKVQEVKPPPSATVKWLKSIGYKSSYDESLLHVLDAIGFRDEGKKPTFQWREYRNRQNASNILAAGIRMGYKALFDVYDDAHARDEDALKNILRPVMDSSDEDVGLAVETFKSLCSAADFEEASSNGSGIAFEKRSRDDMSVSRLSVDPNNVEASLPALHIDIQIHISADASEAQIDAIFDSMAKHLYGKTTS